MWGMIPLGDPQNRPSFRMQLNSLVGGQPENNLVQDIAAGGATAVVDTGGISIQSNFRSKSYDALPPTVTNLPNPQVQYGFNVTYDNSHTVQNAGLLDYQYQRTAQIYTKMFHTMVNNANAIDMDYFGLWLTEDRQTARWEYDAAAGNFQDYYEHLLAAYKRYLPKGTFIADFESGEVPELPKETPFNALMSPDAKYAQAAGVAPTPNMTTAWRFPAGTAMSGAYVGIYTLGLVTVPY